MLTPAEKVVVNLTVLIMALLLSFAIYTSMPTHARLMASRFWYYVTGTVEEVVHNVGLHKGHFKGVRDAFSNGAEALAAQAERASRASEHAEL